MNPANNGWSAQTQLVSKSYICAYCNNTIASDKGYKLGRCSDGSGEQVGGIYICPHCKMPTYIHFFDNVQLPNACAIANIKGLPDELSVIYDEARKCMSSSSYTAVAMLCRKILMNVSVEEGADEGLDFKKYVQYIAANNLVPNKCKPLLEKIRQKGAEANHQIEQISLEDAKALLNLTYYMLVFNYELPDSIK